MDQDITKVSDDPIDRFVVPFYLNFMSLNFVNFKRKNQGSTSRSVFEQRISDALENIDRDTVKAILKDDGWRTQLTGSWFCAIKGWTEFHDVIGSNFMRDTSVHAGRGHCIALYSFADAPSIEYLCSYLDTWLVRHDVKLHQADAMQALTFIDEKAGTKHAAKYLVSGGLWEQWVAASKEHNQTSFAWSVLALDYLRGIQNR